MAIAPNGLRTPRPPCDQPSTPLAWLEHNPSAPSSPLSPPDHHRGWVVTIDFPHIPYPASPAVFAHVSDKGGQLRRLHLMEDAVIGATPYPYEGDGDSVVDKPRYEGGKVWINATQARLEHLLS